MKRKFISVTGRPKLEIGHWSLVGYLVQIVVLLWGIAAAL